MIAAKDALCAAVNAEVGELCIRARRSWNEASDMAERVQQLRREMPKLSQRELGKHLGMSSHLVWYYLNPKCKRPVLKQKTVIL